MAYSPTTQLAYAEAYERAEAAGGGFRGVARNALTGETFQGQPRETLAEAKNDAKAVVHTWAAGRNWVTGTFRNRPSRWQMNYFIRTDEAAVLPFVTEGAV